MSNPFVGEIRMFGGNFAPQGWALCQGQLLAIAENEVLFNLIGTTYGGDGQTTFALPNLQSRIPLHQGQGPGLANNRVLSETGGQEQVTLSSGHLPPHGHPVFVAKEATSGSPINNLPGATTGTNFLYHPSGGDGHFANAGNIAAGGSQPHDNVMPFLTINFIISLFGIFPNPA